MEYYRSNELHPFRRSTVISILISKNGALAVVAHSLHYNRAIGCRLASEEYQEGIR